MDWLKYAEPEDVKLGFRRVSDVRNSILQTVWRIHVIFGSKCNILG